MNVGQMAHTRKAAPDPGRVPAADRQLAQTYRAFLEEKSRFCDRLETLADRLPHEVDRQDCLVLAQNVVPLVRRAHAFEEDQVFTLLDADPMLDDSLRKALERLRFEHLGDEEFANDLCLALRDFAIAPGQASPDTLSWMLRGFFEGLRRHIAFEQAIVLPMIEQKADH